MTRSKLTLKIAFAVAGALALALPLAACGRKGPLDPPPGGYVLAPGTVRTPVTQRAGAPIAETPARKDETTYDEQGHPIAPAGQKRHLPGDWLLN